MKLKSGLSTNRCAGFKWISGIRIGVSGASSWDRNPSSTAPSSISPKKPLTVSLQLFHAGFQHCHRPSFDPSTNHHEQITVWRVQVGFQEFSSALLVPHLECPDSPCATRLLAGEGLCSEHAAARGMVASGIGCLGSIRVVRLLFCSSDRRDTIYYMPE